LFAQTAPEGLWQGYDGEWKHVSQQLIALAEATPAEKFCWRPAAGVRSTSEVYMHIVMGNFRLLSVTGPKPPADFKTDLDKTVTAKADVIAWLKRSLDAVKEARLAVKPADLERKVHIADRDATVDACISASLFMLTNIWAVDRLCAHDWRGSALVEGVSKATKISWGKGKARPESGSC